MSSNDLDFDDGTLHLVIRLQLEDLQGLKRAIAKGKRREGETPDFRVAIEAYELELRRQAQVISDRSLCRRIARANPLDGRVINALIALDNQTRRDIEAALRVLGAPPAPPYVATLASSCDDLPPYPYDRAKAEVDDNLDSGEVPKAYIYVDVDDNDDDNDGDSNNGEDNNNDDDDKDCNNDDDDKDCNNDDDDNDANDDDDDNDADDDDDDNDADDDSILDQPESSSWAASRVLQGKRPSADKPLANEPPVNELPVQETLVNGTLVNELRVGELGPLVLESPVDGLLVDEPEPLALESPVEEPPIDEPPSPHAAEVEGSTCHGCLMMHLSSKEVASCPCSHEYCADCLRSLFKAAIADESLFPPKCCGKPIPVDDDGRHFLTPKLVSEFHAKEIEFCTPNRTYCHWPVCSAFVPKDSIKHDVATCPKCRHETCVMCKGASHRVGEDCKHDEATQLVLQLAAQNRWQRCYSCGRVVELEHGCYHIICRCRAEFCYICGSKWKSCKCTRWDEARLYARS